MACASSALHVILFKCRLRAAIFNRFVDGRPETLLRAQQALAQQFEEKLKESKGEAPLRLVIELPWLYQQMGDKDSLRLCITDSRIFSTLCTEMTLGNYDLMDYWRYIGDPPENISASYMRLLDAQLQEVRKVFIARERDQGHFSYCFGQCF